MIKMEIPKKTFVQKQDKITGNHKNPDLSYCHMAALFMSTLFYYGGVRKRKFYCSYIYFVLFNNLNSRSMAVEVSYH